MLLSAFLQLSCLLSFLIKLSTISQFFFFVFFVDHLSPNQSPSTNSYISLFFQYCYSTHSFPVTSQFTLAHCFVIQTASHLWSSHCRMCAKSHFLFHFQLSHTVLCSPFTFHSFQTYLLVFLFLCCSLSNVLTNISLNLYLAKGFFCISHPFDHLVYCSSLFSYTQFDDYQCTLYGAFLSCLSNFLMSIKSIWLMLPPDQLVIR